MKLTIEKDQLMGALERVSPATGDKNPVHKNVRLRVMEDSLELSASNGLVSARVRAYAEVEETGDVAVEGRTLSRSVQLMPDGALNLVLDQTMLQVSSGKRRHRLVIDSGWGAGDVTPAPEDALELPIEAGTLKSIINRVAFALPGESMPTANGIVVEASPDEGKLYVVVFGRHHLVKLEQVYDGGGNWTRGMIPKILIGAIEKLCDPGDQILRVKTDGTFLRVESDSAQVMGVVPHGAMLNWRLAFDRVQCHPLARFSVSELTKTIRSVLVSTKSGVRIETDGHDRVRVFVQSDEGFGEDHIEAESTREAGLQVGAREILEPLSKMKGDNVLLMTGSNSLVVMDDEAGGWFASSLMTEAGYDYTPPAETKQLSSVRTGEETPEESGQIAVDDEGSPAVEEPGREDTVEETPEQSGHVAVDDKGSPAVEEPVEQPGRESEGDVEQSSPQEDTTGQHQPAKKARARKKKAAVKKVAKKTGKKVAKKVAKKDDRQTTSPGS
jgi:DNA polymerase III sliding clamp (beta) subunit (PCNA family)